MNSIQCCLVWENRNERSLSRDIDGVKGWKIANRIHRFIEIRIEYYLGLKKIGLETNLEIGKKIGKKIARKKKTSMQYN